MVIRERMWGGGRVWQKSTEPGHTRGITQSLNFFYICIAKHGGFRNHEVWYISKLLRAIIRCPHYKKLYILEAKTNLIT